MGKYRFTGYRSGYKNDFVKDFERSFEMVTKRRLLMNVVILIVTLCITFGGEICLAGEIAAWGLNNSGQLGDGTTTNRTTPVAVSGLSGAVAIAAGFYHTVALLGDGSCRAWGYNGYGQLGDGTYNGRLTPVAVSGLSDVAAIAAGGWHTVALLDDGTCRAWGYNSNGQLGDGTTTLRTTPVAVSGLTNVVSIAAGRQHTVALLGDGTCRTWGENSEGQLGDGTTTGRSTPVAVSGLSGAVAIAAGDLHTVALLADGTVRAWGYNFYGQLGDGTTTNRTTPVAVSGLSGVVAIAGGFNHTVALLDDGTCRAWGDNNYGQLGDGTTTDSTTPIAVFGLYNAVAIAAGENHSLGLKAEPMGTAFTYQGILSDANSHAEGAYDLQFSLYSFENLRYGDTLNIYDLDVVDGYFTAQLDFGSDVFNGNARWLEIAVRPGQSSDPNDFVTLSPRQEITPTPYAMQSRGLFVDSSGKVGIGTISPAAKLDVNGTAKILAWHDQDVSTNGYTWVGNILFQWGQETSTSSVTQWFNFPIQFPNDCFAVSTSLAGEAWGGASNFAFDRLDSYVGNKTFQYMAIGH
jgi:alpha-tubulin suppressor-like RCC1 family protein